MTRSAARVLALVCCGIAAAGVLAGLMPIKDGSVSCGRAWGGSRDRLTCVDKRASVRLVLVPMILAGGAVGAVAWIGRDDED